MRITHLGQWKGRLCAGLYSRPVSKNDAQNLSLAAQEYQRQRREDATGWVDRP